MKIAVLFGGISTERKVSIKSGKAVCAALEELGYDVLPVDPAFGADVARGKELLELETGVASFDETEEFSPRSLMDCVNSDAFDDVDVAFIALHGKFGEDGVIQSLLELREIPYTGSGVKASSLAMDKTASKMFFQAAGILTPPGLTLADEDLDDYSLFEDIRKELGSNLVIKPNDQGSTIGISIVRGGNLDDIRDAVIEAFEYSSEVVVERFIDGRELTVGIIGGDILPVIEIIPESGFYDFEHKYIKGKTEYECPADLPDDIADFMQNLAFSAYRILGCEGFARVDFRLSDEGQPYCLEINTIPGFTETSLVPMAASEVGVEFPQLCERLVKIALGEELEDIDDEEEVEE